MRVHLTALALALGLGITAGAAAQGTYPDRPVRLVVGSTPGGAADFVGRAVGDALARALGQPVVIDNRPGAGSSLGAEYVTKAAPDGYTILVASPSAIAINPAAEARWASAYTLVPVAKLTASPLVVTTNPQLGVKSVRELVAFARKNPAKANFAHAGVGTPSHLAGVLFNQMTGAEFVAVSFKGGGPAVNSVMAGDTQLTFASPPSIQGLLPSGKLQALAVTSPKRFAYAPDVPSAVEAGLPKFRMDLWYGLFVPPGTPADVQKKLFDAVNKSLRTREFQAMAASGGMEVSLLPTSADFAAFVKEEHRFWDQLIKSPGVNLKP